MIRFVCAALALLGAFGGVLWASPAAAQSFNAQEQAEIRAVVRDYLVRNPDVLREALDALEKQTASERRQHMENDPRDFALGARSAPITIVEFFDYRCPYCHAALDWVRDLARTRSDVRIVFKELPVLGPESMEAARAAIAANRQGRYWQFHQTVMAFRGELSSARLDALARQAGVDVARMRRDMQSEEITRLLEANHELAYGAGITGTPGFMIQGELISGFDRRALEAKLRDAAQAARRRS
jgi:protein-disulfide isomerase